MLFFEVHINVYVCVSPPHELLSQENITSGLLFLYLEII